MTVKYYTIGMAGHIDHGKTTLTKALSGVDTDTLKEEKERKITIEPGFAPFPLTDEINTSIVDVPGHEKFIRQMIAGVAGIDLVLLVIAADEGVMPQTREHFEILSYLGIETGVIVVTKSDLIDEEMRLLVEEDIGELTRSTAFATFPVHFVDSISMSGIDDLKNEIGQLLQGTQTRSSQGPFRMPIDHIFTVKGQGTVVRGTVYEGEVREGDDLIIEPGNDKVKIRKLQVHKQDVNSAKAGQRAALNLSGGSRTAWKRGHVLLSPHVFSTTDMIDIVLSTGNGWDGKIKQRAPVKFYTGTSEVMGKLVFFDRNELENNSHQIFCQVRLDEEIVTKRGDKYIIRRPSPEETIGGGEVIDPNGSIYKFGTNTIELLKSKYEGTPQERVLHTLEKEGSLTEIDLKKLTGFEEQDFNEAIYQLLELNSIHQIQGYYFAALTLERVQSEWIDRLKQFHEENPLRQGIPKAEAVQYLKGKLHPKVVNGLIDQWIETSIISVTDQFVHLSDFKPDFPQKWSMRMSQVLERLEEMKLEPDDLLSLFKSQQLPEELYNDYKYHLIKTNHAVVLFDEVLLSKSAFDTAVEQLRSKTNGSFTVQEAKVALDTSRKFLIPFLECLDTNGYTIRDSNVRKWV
ncbi:selenocysteine-specific translation elongation factor [Fictibacillus sp. b24]|uniref:selenocysteine-specific translation elongation factor n=1 Tax=Fictibacillus sp. b24 TaxID=3055863 RepID=UPI0025A01554|nr:selenocysteine-specific translation elongation factor [Fictibacillus sp. b24]MDM5316398.1 selenocysteine-specific translation elongation factor [Fictibacillus sp. b24]